MIGLNSDSETPAWIRCQTCSLSSVEPAKSPSPESNCSNCSNCQWTVKASAPPKIAKPRSEVTMYTAATESRNLSIVFQSSKFFLRSGGFLFIFISIFTVQLITCLHPWLKQQVTLVIAVTSCHCTFRIARWGGSFTEWFRRSRWNSLKHLHQPHANDRNPVDLLRSAEVQVPKAKGHNLVCGSAAVAPLPAQLKRKTFKKTTIQNFKTTFCKSRVS